MAEDVHVHGRLFQIGMSLLMVLVMLFFLALGGFFLLDIWPLRWPAMGMARLGFTSTYWASPLVLLIMAGSTVCLRPWKHRLRSVVVSAVLGLSYMAMGWFYIHAMPVPAPVPTLLLGELNLDLQSKAAMRKYEMGYRHGMLNRRLGCFEERTEEESRVLFLGFVMGAGEYVRMDPDGKDSILEGVDEGIVAMAAKQHQ